VALEITYHPLSSCVEAAPVLVELAAAVQGALGGMGAPEATGRSVQGLALAWVWGR